MEQPQNLRSLFAEAKREKAALDARPDTNSDSYRGDVNATIAKFEECHRLVGALSMFSSNELLEDLSTSDLPYLTVEYHLAELLQRSYTSDRELTLQRALGQYEKYLARLEDYELLDDKDKKLYERYVAKPSSFSLTPTNDAATRREVKITRFKEEKELKQRLGYLSENHQRLQSDEDDVRQLYLAEIKLYTHQAFQSLDLLAQELSMLSTIRNLPSKPEDSQSDDPRRRIQPLQPFTLLDRRTQLRDGVFRSGHNLPTMTIDEYLEEEKRRGGIIEGGENSGQQEEIDEDDMDKADEETLKARAWDEFKEANPRGSGNTLNRG
ncbi:hypothetical protein AOCH_001875 [Aspergillus ochraceoroseus]|uniref:TOR signaling pathway regulator (TapA) n=1 Tax=Aspergillus ochraceoroseus TaxID=138278 RepID=A0A0F8WUH7_9EURO|nr:hypothetical protein AOCH_001875 [Aspergillus ochraceoroseus]